MRAIGYTIFGVIVVPLLVLMISIGLAVGVIKGIHDLGRWTWTGKTGGQ